MAKKTVDNQAIVGICNKLDAMDQRACLFEARVEERFREIMPYIEGLEDIRSAGKVARWVVGVVMAAGALYLMIKSVFMGVPKVL